MDPVSARKGPSDADEHSDGKLRQSIERRLRFIEFRLYWEGRVNRGDLVENFGVSVPQASVDLARYQQIAAGNITYDKVAKAYVATERFHPIFFVPSADEFLARLRTYAAGGFDREGTWLEQVPSFDAVPLLRRRVEPVILRNILGAIRSRFAVKMEYQSVSAAGPKSRWIWPHAIVFDGFRWHARAWCYEHQDFRDFVLARMIRCIETKVGDVDNERDREWHERVTLRLAPHPNLTGGIRRAIELDFGMTAGVLDVTTRIALSTYFERLHGLDLDPAEIPEYRQQLVLLNRDEVESARTQARANGVRPT